MWASATWRGRARTWSSRDSVASTERTAVAVWAASGPSSPSSIKDDRLASMPTAGRIPALMRSRPSVILAYVGHSRAGSASRACHATPATEPLPASPARLPCVRDRHGSIEAARVNTPRSGDFTWPKVRTLLGHCQHCDPSASLWVEAWWERLPETETIVRSVQVHPGSSVTLSLSRRPNPISG